MFCRTAMIASAAGAACWIALCVWFFADPNLDRFDPWGRR